MLHDGPFDAAERLDLLQRLGVTVLCQSPAEYRALAETGRLGRYRWARPRRLVSTGDELEDDVVQAFEDEWGLTIQDGIGTAEAGVFAGHWGDGAPRGSLGSPLPGYDVAVVDERGNEVPDGYAGELAVRGGTPPLFAGYWNAPDATKAAYRGDWFVTGDVGGPRRGRDSSGSTAAGSMRRHWRPSPSTSRPTSRRAPEPVVERAVLVPAPDRRSVRPATTPEPPSAPADLDGIRPRTSPRSAPISPGSQRRSGCSRPAS